MAATARAASTYAFDRPDTGAVGAYVTELYERHARAIQALCRSLLRDRAEAEDATQQTFLSAYRAVLGRGAPREPAAWLATIARNECWSRSRARMREPLAEPDHDGSGPAAPDALAETIARYDARRIGRALARLPRKQREALLLREVAGCSYPEVARRLEVSESAVDSLLVRARRGLKKTLTGLAGVFPFPAAVARLLGLGAGTKAAATGVAALGLVVATVGVDAVPTRPDTAAASPAIRVVADRTVSFAPSVLRDRPLNAHPALRARAAARAPHSDPLRPASAELAAAFAQATSPAPPSAPAGTPVAPSRAPRMPAEPPSRPVPLPAPAAEPAPAPQLEPPPEDEAPARESTATPAAQSPALPGVAPIVETAGDTATDVVETVDEVVGGAVDDVEDAAPENLGRVLPKLP